MANELIAISFKVPAEMRERIKAAAAAEERTEASFLRHRLRQILNDESADEEETDTDPDAS